LPAAFAAGKFFNLLESLVFMDTKLSPPVKAFLPASVLLMLLGWAGFLAVINLTEPNGGTRWLFFFFLVLAFTGTAMPGVAWVGIYLPTLAWLQIGRVLTPSLALLLALGFVLIEGLLRMRERSQWKPQ
jgi:hypothetical protein